MLNAIRLKWWLNLCRVSVWLPVLCEQYPGLLFMSSSFFFFFFLSFLKKKSSLRSEVCTFSLLTNELVTEGVQKPFRSTDTDLRGAGHSLFGCTLEPPLQPFRVFNLSILNEPCPRFVPVVHCCHLLFSSWLCSACWALFNIHFAVGKGHFLKKKNVLSLFWPEPDCVCCSLQLITPYCAS